MVWLVEAIRRNVITYSIINIVKYAQLRFLTKNNCNKEKTQNWSTRWLDLENIEFFNTCYFVVWPSFRTLLTFLRPLHLMIEAKYSYMLSLRPFLHNNEVTSPCYVDQRNLSIFWPENSRNNPRNHWTFKNILRNLKTLCTAIEYL